MKQRFQLEDPKGRYMTAEYDDDKGVLMVTTYLQPEPGVPIEETLENAGFMITSKMNVEKPQIVNLNERKNNEKSS